MSRRSTEHRGDREPSDMDTWVHERREALVAHNRERAQALTAGPPAQVLGGDTDEAPATPAPRPASRPAQGPRGLEHLNAPNPPETIDELLRERALGADGEVWKRLV